MKFNWSKANHLRGQTKKPSSLTARRHCFERLETRTVLSATGLAGLAATPLFTGPYVPSQIAKAYGLTNFKFTNGATGDGSGQTIAIIDAYGDPNAQSDLGTFDAANGLPPPPNFEQVGQSGGSTAGLSVDSGWAMETSLDVQWAHATAPGANLLLVEANSSGLSDLLTAVDFARNDTLTTSTGVSPVTVVSMSWGASEFRGETSYDGHFKTPAGHAGVSFVAATGDSGGAAGWPAVSPNVLAVGGTSLSTQDSSGTYQSESAWIGSSGGISRYEAEPSYQNSVERTGRRATPDVSLNADPNTGYVIYDSVPYYGSAGWWQIGGTSASTPIWAAMVAVANQGRMANGLDSLQNVQADVYSIAPSHFRDITSGYNGYNFATAGYDLVTGIGTPRANLVINDLAAMTASTAAQPARSSGPMLVAPHLARPKIDTGSDGGGDPGDGSDLGGGGDPVSRPGSSSLADTLGAALKSTGTNAPVVPSTASPATLPVFFVQTASPESSATTVANHGMNPWEADASVRARYEGAAAMSGRWGAVQPGPGSEGPAGPLLRGATGTALFGSFAPAGSNVQEEIPSAQAVDQFFLQGPGAVGVLPAVSLASGARTIASESASGDVASSDDLQAWEATAAVFAWFAAHDRRQPLTFSNRQVALHPQGS